MTTPTGPRFGSMADEIRHIMPSPPTHHARHGASAWSDEIRHILLTWLLDPNYTPGRVAGVPGMTADRVRHEEWAVIRDKLCDVAEDVASLFYAGLVISVVLGALAATAVLTPWQVSVGALIVAVLVVVVAWQSRRYKARLDAASKELDVLSGEDTR